MELPEVQQDEALEDQGQVLLGVASLRVVYVCVRTLECARMCVSPPVEVLMWRSEDTFQESLFPCYHVGPGN